jgi:hypothetical protein
MGFGRRGEGILSEGPPDRFQEVARQEDSGVETWAARRSPGQVPPWGWELGARPTLHRGSGAQLCSVPRSLMETNRCSTKS